METVKIEKIEKIEKKEHLRNKYDFNQEDSEAKLGPIYQEHQTEFRVWSPTYEEMDLLLYDSRGRRRKFPMKRDGNYFFLVIEENLDGYFYQYYVNGKAVTDPYSKSSSINSQMSAVIDLDTTNPPGFSKEEFVKIPMDEVVIYELHVSDFSFHKTSGSKYPGKYLAFTEDLSWKDFTIGLGHIKDLGISHIHLMPVNDFISVNEEAKYFGKEENYNWGYDPESYFVPEGSYATRPEDPKNRVFELKAMVQAIHQAGMGVILDVVYNHTYKTRDSNLNILAPMYYYRSDEYGLTNGSGVGNEIASEKPMARKLIIESLLYWQEEYKIDGFRFDLMALTDKETIHIARDRLRENNPYTVIYGEPWSGAASGLNLDQQTLWGSQVRQEFSLFNDSFRNAIKGSNDGNDRGFIQGNATNKKGVIKGLLGSVFYDENFNGILSSPLESINYFNAHDNLILEDKLRKSVGDNNLTNRMTKLAFSILLTAQGVPFFHAGNEFRRNKKMNHNSYNAPFSVNNINWSLKETHEDLNDYVKDLIDLRKKHPVLRLRRAEDVQEKVRLVPTDHPNLIVLLYREEKNWLLVLHYSGWEDYLFPFNKVLDQIQREKVIVEPYFDENGYNDHRKFNINRAMDDMIFMDGISTRILKIY